MAAYGTRRPVRNLSATVSLRQQPGPPLHALTNDHPNAIEDALLAVFWPPPREMPAALGHISRAHTDARANARRERQIRQIAR